MNYIPSTMHKAIRWSKNDPFLEWDHLDRKWSIVNKRGCKQAATTKPDMDGSIPSPKKIVLDTLRNKHMIPKENTPKKRKRSEMFCDNLQKLDD